MSLSIGALSTMTGVKVVTIRYYEQIGLLPAPDRTDGRQRRYPDSDVVRLRFIRQARELGFEVDSIRDLLKFADEDKVPDAELVRRLMDEVRSKIDALESLRQELFELGTEGTPGRSLLIEALVRAPSGTAASRDFD
ncbi:MerR family transcriptional regulator [Methylobacterium sp. 1030]|uniref:MerR family transcriptional regulator n=1 Tax=Methylobacterium sp. 1030 TaxID=3156404 RepID=UPI00339861A4